MWAVLFLRLFCNDYVHLVSFFLILFSVVFSQPQTIPTYLNENITIQIVLLVVVAR